MSFEFEGKGKGKESETYVQNDVAGLWNCSGKMGSGQRESWCSAIGDEEKSPEHLEVSGGLCGWRLVNDRL